jgi:FKBP-type peptidyl-prolyl cis-trans isomerase 2
MREFHRNIPAIVAMVTLLTCLGLLSQQGLAAEKPAGNPRIIDGSRVTYFSQITVPGECEFEVRKLGQFVQGRHQLPPALELVVIGMKTGDKKKVELSAEEGFGSYDAKKTKTVPKGDLPAGTKEGDVLKDRAGHEATVAQLSERYAVMDYNHPLAGKPLSIKISILRVDDPS